MDTASPHSLVDKTRLQPTVLKKKKQVALDSNGREIKVVIPQLKKKERPPPITSVLPGTKGGLNKRVEALTQWATSMDEYLDHVEKREQYFED